MKVQRMKDTFLNALKRRRSQYALGPNVQLSPAEIQTLVTETLRHTPSAFHSQSSRAILLFGQESEQLWQLIEDHLRAIAPAENFAATEDKLRGFAAGAGTLLFFEDQQVVEALQKRYALYAEHFPVRSEERRVGKECRLGGWGQWVE